MCTRKDVTWTEGKREREGEREQERGAQVAMCADCMTGVDVPEGRGQYAVLHGRQPVQLLWASPGLQGQGQPGAGSSDTEFPAMQEEASPAERTELVGWAGNGGEATN